MKYNIARIYIFCSTPHKISTKNIFNEIILYVHCTNIILQKNERANEI